ncbi:MAG: universal stress protein [Chlorobium sp.]|nr:universal stress protein [Chlorobium phaeovibrioides]NQU46569.1 universal stress protein [Chlorobium sp.]
MKTITACLDGSTGAKAVCEAAVWASLKLKAPLQLLHVLEKESLPPSGDLSGTIGFGSRQRLLEQLVQLDAEKSRIGREHGDALLDEAKTLARQSGVADLTTLQLHGSLVETLKDLEPAIRLAVMGRQGELHSKANHAIGSHLEHAIRTLHCPVLVVLQEFRIPDRFMIAFDASPTSRKALDLVMTSPLLSGSECHVVMAGKAASTHTTYLEAATRDLQAKGFNTTAAVLEGTAAEALQSYAETNRMALMVMGAYGHKPIRRFLVGSTTTRMLAETAIPLLILR